MFKRRVVRAALFAFMANFLLTIFAAMPAAAAPSGPPIASKWIVSNPNCVMVPTGAPDQCVSSLQLLVINSPVDFPTGNTVTMTYVPNSFATDGMFVFHNINGGYAGINTGAPSIGLVDVGGRPPIGSPTVDIDISNIKPAWFNPTVKPDPTLQKLNLDARVSFGASDNTLSTSTLAWTVTRVGAATPAPTSGSVDPDEPILANQLVNYVLTPMATGIVNGQYKVCVKGDFLKPAAAYPTAADGSLCQTVTKARAALTVQFLLTGDSTKLTSTTAGGKTNCDSDSGFTWVMCGVIYLFVGDNGIVPIIETNVIVPFLKEPPLDNTQADVKPAYAIWTAFRNLASIFFILVFFLIIIGTAAGFDNYTVKKVLPHLVAGAILMPFSWEFCALIIDIGNVLGQGLVALISPLATPDIDLTANWAGVFGITAGSVAIFALIGAAAVTAGLGAVVTLLLAFVGVFLTLILRKMILMVLVVISPFAFLAWVLPNTEKWFKMWWQDFFKLVMMYPIIMMLFEAGRLFAATAGATLGGQGVADHATEFVKPLVQITALIMPLFLIPFAFKFAGKGLSMASNTAGKLTGAADKRFGKDSARAKQAAENRANNSSLRATAADQRIKDKNIPGLKLGSRMSSRLNHRRSGLAKPAPWMPRNIAQENAREALKNKAFDARANYEGGQIKSGMGLEPESVEDRAKAQALAVAEQKRVGQQQRMGLLEGVTQQGDNYNANQVEQYKAGKEAGRKAEGVKVSQGIGANKATLDHPIEMDDIIAGGAITAEAKLILENKELAGNIQGNHERDLEVAAQQLVDSTKGTPGAVTIEQARESIGALHATGGAGAQIAAAHELRMKNLAKAATDNAAGKHLASDISTDTANNVNTDADIEAAAIALHAAGGPGAPASVDAARAQIKAGLSSAPGTPAALAAGRIMATGRLMRNRSTYDAKTSQDRSAQLKHEAQEEIYNEAEHLAGGPESAADIFDGTTLLDRKGIIENRMKGAGAIDAAKVNKPESSGTLMNNARLKAAKGYAGQQADDTAETKAREDERLRDLDPATGLPHAVGSDGSFQAAASRTYKALSDPKARQLIKATSDEQGAIEGDEAHFLEQHAKSIADGVTPLDRAGVRAKRLTDFSAAATKTAGKAKMVEFAQTESELREHNTNGQTLGTVYQAAVHSTGKDAADKTGAIEGAIIARDTEAKKDGLVAGTEEAARASIRRGTAARKLEVGAQMSDAVGKQEGIIVGNRIKPMDASQRLEDAEKKTSNAINNEAETIQANANEFNDDVDKLLGYKYDDATASPAQRTQRNAAFARVSATRLAAAGATTRSVAERAANKKTRTDKGIQNDIEDKVVEEAETARLLAASAGTANPLTPEAARDAAKASIEAGTHATASPAARAAAADSIRQRELANLGAKAEQDAGFAHRAEVGDAAGTQTSMDAQIDAEAERLVGPGLDEAAHKTALISKRATAVANVKRRNLNNAGEVAEIAGQNAQAKKTTEAQTIVDTYNESSLKQAPVEVARIAARDKAYNEHMDKVEAEATAAGKSPDEIKQAKKEAENDAMKAGKDAADEATEEVAERYRKGEITRAEQVRASISATTAATKVSTSRAQDATQASTNALAQAENSEGDPGTRLAAYTETAVARDATAVANEKASAELSAPGQEFHQTYQQVEAEATRTARANLLASRVKTAGQREEPIEVYEEEEIPVTDPNDPDLPLRDTNGDFIPMKDDAGNILTQPMMRRDPTTGRILKDRQGKSIPVIKRVVRDKVADADPTEDMVRTYARRARELLGHQKDANGDFRYNPDGSAVMGDAEDRALGMAMLGKLTQTGKGRAPLDQIQTDMFGQTDDQTIDPTRMGGHARELWEQVQASSNYDKNPTLYAPADAVSDGMPPKLFVSQNYMDMGKHFEYAQRKDKQNIYSETSNNIKEALENKQNARFISDDHYQQMWMYIQNPKARAALENVENGKELVRKIYERGSKAGVTGSKWRYSQDAGKRRQQIEKDAELYALDNNPTTYVPAASIPDRTTRQTEVAARVAAFEQYMTNIDPRSLQPGRTRRDYVAEELNAQPATLVPPAISQSILTIANNDADLAVHLAERYANPTPTAADTAFRNFLTDRITAGTPIKPADASDPAVAAVAPPPPPPPVPGAPAPAPTLPAAAVKQLSVTPKGEPPIDIGVLRDAANRYRSDPAYRTAVDAAILNGQPIPR